MRFMQWTGLTLAATFALAIGTMGCQDEAATEQMGDAIDVAAEGPADAVEAAEDELEEAAE